jgi:putative membrane protein
MPRLTLNHARVIATIGLAIVALSMPLQSAAQSQSGPGPGQRAGSERPTGPPQDTAATAPESAGTATSGGATNSLGDPKSNRAGIARSGEPQDRLELGNADRKLMRELAQAHLAEIKMSGLATAISANPAIRGYGEKMLEEHLTALDELRSLADRSGVILPGGLDKEHAAVLRQLALKAGDEFDRMYMEQAGFASHEQSHRVFQEASSRAQSPELKSYAARLVPVIGQHLQLAQQMRENPGAAAAAVQSSVYAGQSTGITAPAGSSSDQSKNSSGAKGAGNIAAGAAGSSK